MVERDVAVLVLLVDQHRMALRKGAALAVLAGQPHRIAAEQQRTEGERLRRRPVNALAGLDRLGTRVKEALDGAVKVKILRRRAELLADLLERFDLNAGDPAAWIVVIARRLHAGPAAVQPIGAVGLVALARFELRIEPLAPLGLHGVKFAVAYHALGNQLLAVNVEGRRMRADGL